MVVSMRVMSDGRGVDYLLRTVVVGDGERDRGTPLTRYYLETGTPPGRWTGTGLPGLGDAERGRLRAGDEVTEAQLRGLLQDARDPLTGAVLGTAHHRHWAARRTATSGFDFTFTVPKSVSVLWGVADAGTQALIARAHHDAVDDVLGLLERRVAATRLGHGGVARVEVRGVIAAAFDHYDSRAGDPNLHTHVVIANRVQGPDGKWRTLDSRALHQAAVALSETYDTVLMDRVTALLGVGWVPYERGADRNAGWRIDGVPVALMDAFSSRSHGAGGIDARAETLIAEYREAHGREPSARVVIRLRQQATLETRPAKELHSLAELTAAWRVRATELLGEDATTWARVVVSAVALGTAGSVPVLRADDVEPQVLDDLAVVVLMAVGSRRAVWRRWNLWAEAARQTAGVRFARATDREAVLDAVVTQAEAASLQLTPDYDRTTPGVFQLADGSSAFQPRDVVAYSSEMILGAETRLLEAVAGRGPRLSTTLADRYALLPDAHGRVLSDDQAAAVTRIATSGRALDVLVGPAGAGKTTALRALRAAWESAAGRDSVIGLAPSAAAADVLGQTLGIRTENTAKWAHEHAAGRWDLQRNQLIIVDEASLAGTLLLDRLVMAARAAGAKVLLVGDWAQLTAIDTGGTFGLVARSLGEAAPELTDVRRFRADWEKAATLGLRHGDAAVLDSYAAQDRVHGIADAASAVYEAWAADRTAGRTSVMIAGASEMVASLGMQARTDRVAAGLVAADGVALHDGTLAGVGDEIVTRRNDRRLTTGSGSWVKNGDRWSVTARFDDGSLAVRRLRRDGSAGASLVLPSEYVAAEVELGYATTVHRAQGLTVDTAHALVDTATATRELLYVAMTRGAEANHVYVSLDDSGHESNDLGPGTPGLVAGPDPGLGATSNVALSTRAAVDALAAVMTRVAAEPSATETLRLEVTAHSSLPRLIAEYETIAAHAVSIGAATWPGWQSPRHRQIAGLIAVPYGRRMPEDYARALAERSRLISRAADHLVADAHRADAPWLHGLDGFAAPTVALYRARHEVTGDDPLGPPADPADKTHARDRRVAHAAIERSEHRRRQRGHDDFGLGHGRDSVERGGYSIGF